MAKVPKESKHPSYERREAGYSERIVSLDPINPNGSAKIDEMVEHQLKAVFSDLLDVDVDRVSKSTSMENTEEWDSVAHIRLIVAIEQEFDIYFEAEEIGSARSFSKVLELIAGKLD